MKIILIGVPQNHGCDKDGVQYGPQKLVENNLEDRLREKGIEVEYIKDIEVEKVNSEDKFKDDENIKYYKSIYDTNEKLADSVYETLNNGYFPII